MEWNGNGMEWNGMDGMEWNEMEWNGMEWNGQPRNRSWKVASPRVSRKSNAHPSTFQGHRPRLFGMASTRRDVRQAALVVLPMPLWT